MHWNCYCIDVAHCVHWINSSRSKVTVAPDRTVTVMEPITASRFSIKLSRSGIDLLYEQWIINNSYPLPSNSLHWRISRLWTVECNWTHLVMLFVYLYRACIWYWRNGYLGNVESTLLWIPSQAEAPYWASWWGAYLAKPIGQQFRQWHPTIFPFRGELKNQSFLFILKQFLFWHFSEKVQLTFVHHNLSKNLY